MPGVLYTNVWHSRRAFEAGIKWDEIADVCCWSVSRSVDVSFGDSTKIDVGLTYFEWIATGSWII